MERDKTKIKCRLLRNIRCEMTTEVAESCFETLHGEMVKYFSEQGRMDKVELIGYHVGYQLIEK